MNRRILLRLAGGLLALSSSVALGQGVCNDMVFTDVTVGAGITHTYARPLEPGAVHNGGAVGADVNGDGWLDLYVAQGDGPNLLYINNQLGGFSNEAAARGAELASLSSVAASAADFDNDGDIDVGVSITVGQSRILVNDGTGNFTQEIVLPFPTALTQSSSFGDVDNDGLLEFAIGQWEPNGTITPQGLFLYKNNGGVLQNYEFRTVPGDNTHIFAPRFADLNGDRLSDMHVGADFNSSLKFMNVGGGMFDGSPGAGGNNDMGHTTGDYDKDGDLDIFTADIADQGGNQLNNNNGQGIFTPVSATAGIGDGEWGWGASFGDLDNDGDLDIYHVNGWQGNVQWKETPSRLFMNNDDGTFDEVAACAGAGIAAGSQGRGMHMFDYDNDGDLDIFVVNNAFVVEGQQDAEGVPVLLRNDTSNGNRWLKVTLAGTPPMHRDGIGSRVYVQTGGTSQMHELHASTNFLSQNPGHIAHFGLGVETVADEVRAEWVTGDAIVFTNVAADQSISLPSPTATVSSRQLSIGQDVTATSNESAPVEWEIEGNTFADPVTISFASNGTKELKLLVYNSTMTQVDRAELIRVEVAGTVGEPDLTTPVPGSTLPSGAVNFGWTDNGAAIDDWQLLIGITVGDNSLYDSGLLPNTTSGDVVAGLPEDGSTIHVTLQWSISGAASQKNYTYTASSGTGVPTMLVPAPGSTLGGASETFQWSTEGAVVTRWRLLAGTRPGGRDLFQQNFSADTTSALVSGLPTDGSAVYVMLRWSIGGVDGSEIYTYTAFGGGDGNTTPTVAISAPANGSTFAVGDVVAFSATASDAEDGDLSSGVSWSSNLDGSLGTGALINAPLSAGTHTITASAIDSGGLSGSDAITVTTTSGGGSGVPTMLTPAPGSTLGGASETFQWSAEGGDVTRWRLLVGTRPGGRDLFQQNFSADITSALVSGLPTDGSPVYVMLRWSIGGVDSSEIYTYTASGGGDGNTTPTVAISAPANGSTFAVGDVVAFSATASDAEDGDLSSGVSWSSSLDGSLGTGASINASLTAGMHTITASVNDSDGLSGSDAIAVTVTSGGGSGVPTMLAPAPGSTLGGASETFQWSAEGAVVTRWRLLVGTRPGGRDLFQQNFSAETTSALVSGLRTDGSPVYVTLRWTIDGIDDLAQFVYTAAGP